MDRIGSQLNEVLRCPHCGIANPRIYHLHHQQEPLPRGDGGRRCIWALYACSSCGSGILAQGNPAESVSNPQVIAILPVARAAHEDLPETARRFLDQAFQTITSPDASAVMAGSAVDAMLKALGYRDGSVYARIDQALADNKLTAGMAQWAHSVRLGANRPRHADAENPHISPQEAERAVEFAEALGHFLFVLNARIERGIATATT